jgi:hypothetical protein
MSAKKEGKKEKSVSDGGSGDVSILNNFLKNQI